MIKINEIKEPIVKLYSPEDYFIGEIKNFLQMNDVRIQIAEEKIFGYYIIYNGDEIRIDKYGNLECWPKGLYDQMEDQVFKLMDSWKDTEEPFEGQKVSVRPVIEPTTKLYDPDDHFIGEIKSVLQLDDVRIQIMQSQLSGYYVIFGETKIFIDKNGSIDEWPDGFYDQYIKNLDKLLFGRINK